MENEHDAETGEQSDENPITKTVRQARDHRDAADEDKPAKRKAKPMSRNAKIAAGAAAVGVGSAALAAALLFANKTKK